MSYDLRIGVKVDGTDIISVIANPEYDQPTYNLGTMFRVCTGWDFNQSEWYRVSEVYDKICHGIAELSGYPKKYKQYEPDNGWGTVEAALKALVSLRDCINGIVDENDWNGWNTIPMEHLWVAW